MKKVINPYWKWEMPLILHKAQEKKKKKRRRIQESIHFRKVACAEEAREESCPIGCIVPTKKRGGGKLAMYSG